MLMYVLMFIAGIILAFKYIMNLKIKMLLIGTLGLIGCMVTIVVGFFPPGSIDMGGVKHYEIMFSVGIVLMLVPILLFYWYRIRNQH